MKYFITSSGTGIGKTLVTTALAYQLRKAGRRVSAIKPVISGYTENDAASDTAQILAAQNIAVNRLNIDAISPWRFAAPLAPRMAAAQEGREIDFSELVAFCKVPSVSDITLIEGAGGVMAPLTNSHTMLDWAEALACPAILVVGTYLGAISHALTAGEALRTRSIPVQAVVVSESEGAPLDAVETAAELKRFMPYAKYIVPLPRVAGEKKLWQDVADLTWILT